MVANLCDLWLHIGKLWFYIIIMYKELPIGFIPRGVENLKLMASEKGTQRNLGSRGPIIGPRYLSSFGFVSKRLFFFEVLDPARHSCFDGQHFHLTGYHHMMKQLW